MIVDLLIGLCNVKGYRFSSEAESYILSFLKTNKQKKTQQQIPTARTNSYSTHTCPCKEEKDRQTQTHRQTHRQTDTQTDRHRQTDIQTDRDGQTDRDRHRDKHRQQTDRNRETVRQTETDRQTYTDREIQTYIHT